MAADIVASPHISHTFIHNVESAFWVLLWMACAYTPTSWDIGHCSSFMKDTISPRVFLDTGGQNKLFFMQAESALVKFTIINNEPFTTFLWALKTSLAAQHMSWPSPPLKLDSIKILALIGNRTSSSSPKPKGDKDIKPSVDNYSWLRDALNDYELILLTFKLALNPIMDWPKHDQAKFQLIVTSNDVQASMQSGSKRSREIAKENGVYISLPAAKRLEPA